MRRFMEGKTKGFVEEKEVEKNLQGLGLGGRRASSWRCVMVWLAITCLHRCGSRILQKNKEKKKKHIGWVAEASGLLVGHA